jgi:hypothetical protein
VAVLLAQGPQGVEEVPQLAGRGAVRVAVVPLGERPAWSLVRLGMGWLSAWLGQAATPPRMPPPRLHWIHLDMR